MYTDLVLHCCCCDGAGFEKKDRNTQSMQEGISYRQESASE